MKTSRYVFIGNKCIREFVAVDLARAEWHVKRYSKNWIGDDIDEATARSRYSKVKETWLGDLLYDEKPGVPRCSCCARVSRQSPCLLCQTGLIREFGPDSFE